MKEENEFRDERRENRTEERVIPVMQEQATISKEVRDTAKVRVETKIIEVEKTVDVPLIEEGYEVKRVPINQYVDAQPQVREEGDITIIPIVREVLIVEKRLELVEEVHVIKRTREIPHKEHFTLKKEEVNIVRTPIDNQKK
jgi:uncharacterized protein (TIGR02271 family)